MMLIEILHNENYIVRRDLYNLHGKHVMLSYNKLLIYITVYECACFTSGLEQYIYGCTLRPPGSSCFQIGREILPNKYPSLCTLTELRFMK